MRSEVHILHLETWSHKNRDYYPKRKTLLKKKCFMWRELNLHLYGFYNVNSFLELPP